MNQVSLPSRRRAFAGFLLSIVWSLCAGVTAGQFKWLVGGDKNTKYETFKDPSGRFELEQPTKDWRRLPSVGASLAVFSRKDNTALLYVDHVRLVDRLTPGEIEAMPEQEVLTLKEQQPRAKDFKSDMLESKTGRGVLVRYSRVGTEPETVMQYSIPVGLDLYRLNGVVLDKELSKYEPVVMHMIQSFKAPAGTSTSKH